MADVKWIKIVTDIFDDEKILLIESMPEADAIIVIWFKLLCLAGKQNNGGVFMLNERIAYTEEMFATIFRRKVTTVRMALKTFEQFGMVEIINDTVTIPNWNKHQTLDSYEKKKERDRLYMQQRRAAQRLLVTQPDDDSQTTPSSDVSSDTSSDSQTTPSSDVVVSDKEEDIDIEEDKKKKKKDVGPASSGKAAGTHSFKPPTLEQVQDYAREKGYTRQEFNPEKFINFYASKGWKVGRNKMKDWQAAVRGWVVRYRDEHGTKTQKTADYSGEWDPKKDW